MTVAEVKQFTLADPTLQAVIAALRNNSWHSTLQTPGTLVNTQDLHALYNIRDELSVSDDHDLVLRAHRLILPLALRQRAIQIAHEGHQGLTKTKRLLREKIWFPGIDSLTKKLLDNCLACQATTIQHPFEPLRMTALPPAPWQQLSIDFCDPLPSGDMLSPTPGMTLTLQVLSSMLVSTHLLLFATQIFQEMELIGLVCH